MFEIGQRVVCVKPAEAVWFPGIPEEHVPEHLPVTGGIYTIREIVTGSAEPGGPHWTEAPGLIGLIFEEIVNEKRLTTNGPGQEQAFHEIDFMPLIERDETVATDIAMGGLRSVRRTDEAKPTSFPSSPKPCKRFALLEARHG